VVLYVLGGNVWCWVFSMAMCGFESFMWQYELLSVLCGNVFFMFTGGNV